MTDLPTHMTENPSTNPFEKALNAQIQTLQDAIQMVQNDQIPNMKVVEQEVFDLCGRIVAAHAHSARECQNQLKVMVGLLDDLEEDIKLYRDKMKAKMK